MSIQPYFRALRHFLTPLTILHDLKLEQNPLIELWPYICSPLELAWYCAPLTCARILADCTEWQLRRSQEGAGHAVMSAYVEIVFDNSDNRLPVCPFYSSLTTCYPVIASTGLHLGLSSMCISLFS